MMSTMVDGFELVRLPYVMVFDAVRHRVRCPYCLLNVPGILAQGDVYRCAGCRVYWLRWMEWFYGAVWIESAWPIGAGLREIEDVYAWRYAELQRPA